MAVITLNDENYKAELSGKKGLVKFYADWCGSCRLFAPKFKKMSNDESLSEYHFFEIDAEKNPEFRKTAEVSNLPYFAYYENGQFKSGLSTAKEEALRKHINEAGV